MRTTINIDERLLELAKRRATETNRTLASIMEDALRVALEARATDLQGPASMPTSGSGGLQPGANLDNNASLLARMEE
jgi:hypothetical protein